jgi:uncharacterized SAM-binding protein YcdF (DUF218 family)
MIFYNLLLPCFYPASLVFILLVVGLFLRKRPGWMAKCLSAAVAILLVFGNWYVKTWMVTSLEWQYLPTNSLPQADAIVLLSGGIEPLEWPRTTIEFGDSGDRLFYAGYLFKQGKAPFILCTGGIVPGSPRPTTHANDMGSLLQIIGVPSEAVMLEPKSRNTHENAFNSLPLLKEKKVKKILLVTSAMHMPRSMGVFRKLYADIEVVPAPTDFHATKGQTPPFLTQVGKLIPTAGNLNRVSEVLHEYIGIVYYKCRGWM